MSKKSKTVKRVCAAIDIGSYSIKVLEAVSEQGTCTLTKFATKNIPPKTSDDGLIKLLKSVVDDARISTKEVNMSLSGPNAIVRFVNMPEMGQQELKNSLKYEAEKYIPFSVDEVNIDSVLLGKSKEEKNQMRVLLAAAKKDLVSKRLEIFNQIDMGVALIDLDAFCVFNAFLVCEKGIDETANIALLNLGHHYTNVVISRGSMPYFTRDIQIGGEYIAKTVAKQLNIDEDQVFSPGLKVPEDVGNPNDSIKSALSKLIDEIRLSFGYYENQYGSPVDKVYLSGGLINLNGILAHFESNLGQKPIVWDPIAPFKIAPDLKKEVLENHKSQLAVVSGLITRTCAV